MLKSLLCGLLVGAAVEFVVLPLLTAKFLEGSIETDSWLGEILEVYRKRSRRKK